MKLGLCVIGCGGFSYNCAKSLVSARDLVDLYFASRDYAQARVYSDRDLMTDSDAYALKV